MAAALLLGSVLSAGAADDKPKEDKPKEEKPKATPAVVTAGSDGFVIQSENGEYKLQLRGLVQFDARFYPGSDQPLAIDNFLVRRARPIFVGALGRYFDFNFTPDFGGGNATIQDFYLNAKTSPKLQFRAGKFKPPIGVEHLQGDAYLAFPERSFPASLEPNRDVGVQLHGEVVGGVVTYAAGVFDGAPDGATVDQDVNDSKDVVGRLFLFPFKKGTSVAERPRIRRVGLYGKSVGRPGRPRPVPHGRAGHLLQLHRDRGESRRHADPRLAGAFLLRRRLRPPGRVRSVQGTHPEDGHRAVGRAGQRGVAGDGHPLPHGREGGVRRRERQEAP